MPVMKQLNIGGTTYDTVGEASVTRVVTTGKKIATITIDGTSSDLYAPSGESYKISLTLNGTTVSNVDYDGSSATEIATAIADDPTTDVVFVINAGSDGGVIIARPCMIQATYNATWGDIATNIYAVFPLWYESAGDRETYLLRLSYSSEAWYAETRTTI